MRRTMILMATGSGVTMLAAVACGTKGSVSVPPGGRASVHAEASALKTQQAVLQAQANLGECEGAALHAAPHNPITAFHHCFRQHYPAGQGGALGRCATPAVLAYFAVGTKTYLNLSELNAKFNTCAEQYP